MGTDQKIPKESLGQGSLTLFARVSNYQCCSNSVYILLVRTSRPISSCQTFPGRQKICSICCFGGGGSCPGFSVPDADWTSLCRVNGHNVRVVFDVSVWRGLLNWKCLTDWAHFGETVRSTSYHPLRGSSPAVQGVTTASPKPIFQAGEALPFSGSSDSGINRL